jgi:hypothetical protein
VLEPIVKCLKGLPRARSIEHQKEERRKHQTWSGQDDAAFRRLRREDLRSTVPLDRRLRWRVIGMGTRVTKSKVDREVRALMRTPNFPLARIRRALRNETTEARTEALKQLQAQGAPVRFAGTAGAFWLDRANRLIEWASLRLEYSKSGELVLTRTMLAARPPHRWDNSRDARQRRQTIAAIEKLLYMAERGSVRQLHQCLGCLWWFVSRSHGKCCPAGPGRSASKCKQDADTKQRVENVRRDRAMASSQSR